MSIAAKVKKLLDAHKIVYRILPHTRLRNFGQVSELLALPADKVLTTLVLSDEHGLLMVIYPLSTNIDFNKLNTALKRNFKVLDEIKVNRIFNDCDAGCWPAVGRTYGLDVLIDKSITRQELVYWSAGSFTALLEMQVEDLLYLNPRAKLLDCISPLVSSDLDRNEQKTREVLLAERKQLFASLPFPALSAVAEKILAISTAGVHSAQELVSLVGKDEHIQQQILLYANLPFNQDSAKPQSDNVQDVVDHVLGFDMVSHIALGVAAGRAFSQNKTGYDTTEFWRHAFYTAAYAERIAQLAVNDHRLDPALSYLCGLFHNFGLLLFSQMYKPEYTMLRKWMSNNPKVSIAVLEKRLLGMGQAFHVIRDGHAKLGADLLRYWGMPDSICIVAMEHHTDQYSGPYAAYVKIIQIANQLLRLESIGDGSLSGVNEAMLQDLGLTLQQVKESVRNIQDNKSSMDLMAQTLSNP